MSDYARLELEDAIRYAARMIKRRDDKPSKWQTAADHNAVVVAIDGVRATLSSYDYDARAKKA